MAIGRDSVGYAYSDMLKSLYRELVTAYLNAGVNSAAKQQVEQKFSAGVALAMAVRDRALALFPPMLERVASWLHRAGAKEIAEVINYWVVSVAAVAGRLWAAGRYFLD